MSLRSITPEALGLAGAEQVARLERTRTSTGPSFVAEHVVKPAALLAKLANPPDELTRALRAHLPAKIRNNLPTTDPKESGITALLARALNKLATGPSLYDATRFPPPVLSAETRELQPQKLSGKKLAQFNRLLLRDAFPEELNTEPKTETIWMATSRTAEEIGPETFLKTHRDYWGIENGDHQRLDCSALEDRLRVRNPNAVTVLGIFHRCSISLFLAWAQKQSNLRDRTYPTWQSVHDANKWRILRQVNNPPE